MKSHNTWLLVITTIQLVACANQNVLEDLRTIPLSSGGIAPAATVVPGSTTSLRVSQTSKADGLMEGVYYGLFFDQWPWLGGSGGLNTTLGPELGQGCIVAEIDVSVPEASIVDGRLRFSIACASWEGRSDFYKHTEYDFWNGPQIDSGIVWTDTVRIYKAFQATVSNWYHIKIDLTRLIADSFGLSNGYLQAIYALIEWDGNNNAELQFKDMKLYRTK